MEEEVKYVTVTFKRNGISAQGESCIFLFWARTAVLVVVLALMVYTVSQTAKCLRRLQQMYF